MPAPDTVTEAIAWLQGEGYVEDVRIEAGRLACSAFAGPRPLAEAVIDHTFRFEGPSDPADEAIVLGVRWPATGTKGLLVSAFGPDADPEHIAALRALTAASG